MLQNTASHLFTSFVCILIHYIFSILAMLKLNGTNVAITRSMLLKKGGDNEKLLSRSPAELLKIIFIIGFGDSGFAG